MVFPPLWDTIDAPPLGPAVLAGALRGAAIRSAFFDVNRDFYGWLLSDESLSWLVDVASSAGASEEQAQIERLRALPHSQREATSDRLAAAFGLATSLGMAERPYLARYLSVHGPNLVALETSRGCWGHCRYCNYVQLNRGYRGKPMEQVAAEVIELQTRAPGVRISFVDDTLAPQRAIRLAQTIAELSRKLGHPIEWEGCFRPDAGLDGAQCRELHASGMYRVFIGFDAATAGMLQEIDKRATLSELRGLVANLLAANIVVSGNFIVGLPGEAESDRRAVLELINELGLDRSQVTASLFGLVRGSWYYGHIDDMGWPVDWVSRVKANDVLTDFLPTPQVRRHRSPGNRAARVLGRDPS
ncbi:MAG: B12-binding domain-containing radical SAM protein [Myxococcales bacterium]